MAEPDHRLRVGCPMWANRSWVGRYLPSTTRAGEELAAYSRELGAVEGNTTFYALPNPSTVERWVEQAAPDFRFCLKLPRTVTHDRRLRHAETEVAEFIDRFAPLHHLMGPTSIQLPASFGPDDVAVLDRFLGGLTSSLPWAVELRHPAFFVGGPAERPVDEVLRRHAIDRVILDSRAFFAGPNETPAEREAWERKPRLPVRPTATADAPVVRFIGRTDDEANPEFWSPWVAKLADWAAEGKTPYFFMHTPDNERSPALARRVENEVRAKLGVPRLEPLEPSAPEPRLF